MPMIEPARRKSLAGECAADRTRAVDVDTGERAVAVSVEGDGRADVEDERIAVHAAAHVVLRRLGGFGSGTRTSRLRHRGGCRRGSRAAGAICGQSEIVDLVAVVLPVAETGVHSGGTLVVAASAGNRVLGARYRHGSGAGAAPVLAVDGVGSAVDVRTWAEVPGDGGQCHQGHQGNKGRNYERGATDERAGHPCLHSAPADPIGQWRNTRPTSPAARQ